MVAVVDSSAVVRLFIPDGPIPDGFEQFMQGVEVGTHIAIAPELMLVEVANVLHKKCGRGELIAEEAETLLSLIQRLPIRLITHGALVHGAMELASELGLSVYDATFLELFRQKGERLFTADKQLANAVLKLSTYDRGVPLQR